MASSVLIASINKGYSLRISRVEFSQAFQPEVFPARDRVWVLKQAKRERERDKRREIEASIEPNTPQLEMLEWVASDPGRLSHSVHVKLVASAKRKQNNCSLRVTYDNTRLPIFSLLSVLRPFLTGGALENSAVRQSRRLTRRVTDFPINSTTSSRSFIVKASHFPTGAYISAKCKNEQSDRCKWLPLLPSICLAFVHGPIVRNTLANLIVNFFPFLIAEIDTQRACQQILCDSCGVAGFMVFVILGQTDGSTHTSVPIRLDHVLPSLRQTSLWREAAHQVREVATPQRTRENRNRPPWTSRRLVILSVSLAVWKKVLPCGTRRGPCLIRWLPRHEGRRIVVCIWKDIPRKIIKLLNCYKSNTKMVY